MDLMVDSRPLTALVADDHAEWRYIITRVLEEQYDVIGYADRGDQVLDMASRLQPDVITLDVSMPGQSGLEALPALRAALPTTIIIVVSTNAMPLYQQEAFARGADGYVPKNRLSQLIPALSEARARKSHTHRRRA